MAETLSRAQEVRARYWAKKSKAALEAEADKIFNWILDLLDSDSADGSVIIWFYTDRPSSTIYSDDKSINNDRTLTADFVESLFKTVKLLFNSEEGYSADIDSNATVKGSSAITLTTSVVE